MGFKALLLLRSSRLQLHRQSGRVEDSGAGQLQIRSLSGRHPGDDRRHAPAQPAAGGRTLPAGGGGGWGFQGSFDSTWKFFALQRIGDDDDDVWRCRLGVDKERPGPRRRVAGVGSGVSEGREPFRSQGEVFPLPEASGGPEPAQSGPTFAAGDRPSPRDHRTARYRPGEKLFLILRQHTFNLSRCSQEYNSQC